MDRFLKTIAFQVTDPDFFAEYEKQVKDSGLKVKDYFFNLIKADIAKSQLQANDFVQDGGGRKDDQQKEQSDEITAQETVITPVSEKNSEQTEDITKDANEPVKTAESAEKQSQSGDPAQSEDMMNLFVKITKEQREALESRKNESGETVGSVLNRLIDNFLEQKRNNNLSESFEAGFKYFSSNIESCDTKASAKIPVKTNQELTDYLNSIGGSRNALMATLVEMEVSDQEIDEDQGMCMSM